MLCVSNSLLQNFNLGLSGFFVFRRFLSLKFSELLYGFE